jgi:hypothetical protein
MNSLFREKKRVYQEVYISHIQEGGLGKTFEKSQILKKISSKNGSKMPILIKTCSGDDNSRHEI